MVYQLENSMVNNSVWWWMDNEESNEEIKEEPTKYIEMSTGEQVDFCDAYEYAAAREPQEDFDSQEDFVNWFFSGNWIKG